MRHAALKATPTILPNRRSRPSVTRAPFRFARTRSMSPTFCLIIRMADCSMNVVGFLHERRWTRAADDFLRSGREENICWPIVGFSMTIAAMVRRWFDGKGFRSQGSATGGVLRYLLGETLMFCPKLMECDASLEKPRVKSDLKSQLSGR